MQNQILNTIFMTLTGTAQGIAMEYMLETNEEKSRRWFRIVYWTMLAVLPSILNVIKSHGELSLFLRNAIHWILVIVAMFCFYTGPLWRRIMAAFSVFIGVMSAELSLLFVVHFTDIKLEQIMDKSSDVSTIITGLGMLISILVISIIVSVWRKVFKKGHSMKYFVVYMIFMLNHMTVIWFMEQEVWSQNLTLENGFSGLTSTICAIVLMAVIFSQVEKEELEARLKKENQRAELEQINLQEAKRRRAEILKITQNSNQDLQEVSTLLRNHSITQAENKLNELLHRIESTREYPYCGIPIINVIISQKHNVCKEKGIMLHVNMKIVKEPDISQMDLCSVFSNILDNAIRACEQVNVMQGEAEIALHAAVVKEYFIVTCTNKTAKAPGLRPEGTGYGLKILEDIANRYKGNVQKEYKDNEFKIQVALKC